jgi:hypothetical protein
VPPRYLVEHAQAGRFFLQAWPILVEKKRNPEEFAVKAATLVKRQQAALGGACQLFYFD